MRLLRIAALVLLGLIWGVALPLCFVTLYSVIELQSTARAAQLDQPKLATLQAVKVANALDAAQARLDRDNATLAGIAQKYQSGHDRLITAAARLEQSRALVKTAAIGTLNLAGKPTSAADCSAPPDVVNLCSNVRDSNACGADWARAQECAIRSDIVGAQATDTTRPSPLHAAMLDEQKAETDYRETMADSDLYFDRMSRWNKTVASDREDMKNTDPEAAVAQGLNALRHFPLLFTIFILPTGAVVAAFTSLVACVGAGVAQLVRITRDRVASPPSLDDFLYAFAVSPLIGALAGFMTFFVVSAGTAFLVDTSSQSAIDSVNSLSAPALASLGIFSGLAAQDAIAWLQAKASAFFKI